MKTTSSVLRALVVAVLVTSGCQPPSTPRADDGLPLTLETLFRQGGGAGRAVLSPDGQSVAVVAQGERGSQKPGIYLVDSSVDEARFLTEGRAPAWSPDGTQLAFVSGGSLMVIPTRPDSPTTTLVTDLTGVRNPAWSPDGRQIAFYSTESGSQDIWLVPAGGSTPAKQLTHDAAVADDSRFTPSWAPDGRSLAFISNRADWWHDDVWLIEISSGATSRVSSKLMASSSPIWSPDGNSLVLMATAKDEYWYEDLAYLFRIDLAAAESGTAKAIAEAPIDMQVYATDYIMRFDPFWSADGEWVYFPYHERGAFDLWAVPAKGGVATRVTNIGGAWTSLDATPDGSRVVFTRDAPTEGRESYLIDTVGGIPRQVTDFSPQFQNVQRPREISFRTFDGLYIQGFLYLPTVIDQALAETADGGSYSGPSCPALVQVHGGGTNSYYQGTNLVEQYLAARGFVVLAINYRGGSGFGREFQELSIEDWLNDQSKDPGAAADWLRQQTWVNDKVGIYGGSYGGMQSMSAITRTPDKFDAAVPMRGIYSQALTLPFADRLGQIFAITGHGGTPEERPEIYLKTETLSRMDRITAPVLVMHGEHDVRAPFRNFELAVERLTELGKEFESQTYPEGHGFRDPANSIDMYSRLEAFFVKHLGSCSAP